MAVAVGTNAGFCAASPDADPSGTTTTMSTRSLATKDTSPAGNYHVTEIGWWCETASPEANFEIALYSHDSVNNEPETRLFVDATNAKGTGAGWKKVTGLNIDLNSSTIYWVAVQLDVTDPVTSANLANAGNPGYCRLTGQTSLPADWGTSGYCDNDGAFAIYAVWEADGAPPAAPYTSINIGDAWKSVSGANVIKINIDDFWKNVSAAKINIGNSWKAVTLS